MAGVSGALMAVRWSERFPVGKRQKDEGHMWTFRCPSQRHATMVCTGVQPGYFTEKENKQKDKLYSNFFGKVLLLLFNSEPIKKCKTKNILYTRAIL